MRLRDLFTATLTVFTLVSLSAGYQQCELNPLQVNPGANARFALILSVRQNDGNEECSRVSQTALQSIAAVEWAVNKINRTGLLTGMTLGILGPSRSYTAASILRLLDGVVPPVPVVSSFASLPELRQYYNFVRTIPADSEQVKAIMQLMKHFGWTYIGIIHTNDNYGINGAEALKKAGKEHDICVNIIYRLETTDTFKNSSLRNGLTLRIREIQSRTKNSEILIVYFGMKSVISSLFQPVYLQQMIELRKVKWVMSDFVGTSPDVLTTSLNMQHTAGIFTVSMSSIPVPEVKTYFDEKWATRLIQPQNDPLKRLMNEVQGPKEEWNKDFVMSNIDSVYALVEAVRQAFLNKCQYYSTICDGFDTFLKTNLVDTLRRVNFSYSSLNDTYGPTELINAEHGFSFDDQGDLVRDTGTPLYDINIYDGSSFIKVGNFTNDQLHLDDSLLTVHTAFTSTCSIMCTECTEMPKIPYRYMQGATGSGSSLFLGIFTLHDKNKTDEFQCGSFRNHTVGYDTIGMEAFFHAVQEVRRVTGLNFSAIAFDDCYSLNSASYIVSEFLSGNMQISDGAGGLVDPQRVAVVIGPYSSGVTVPLSFQFMNLKIPVVSYASTSPDLDDRNNFPYFFRTVPSDIDQAAAMIQIIRKFNWHYVGLVYVDNNYGSKGKELLMRYAIEHSICIADPIVVSDSPNEDYYNVLAKMNSKKTSVFLYFGTDTVMRNILQKLDVFRDNFHFMFIASEDNYDILQQFGAVSEGSLVFKIDTITVDKTFNQYLRDRTPQLETGNSWFREFWSYYFGCNPIGGFDKRDFAECSNGQYFNDSSISKFVNDQSVNQIMNAVYASGVALKEVQEKLCIISPPPCENSMERANEMAAIFQDVKLNISQSGSTSQFQVFNNERNGNLGFEILNVQQSGNSYRNVKVGSYRSGSLTMENIESVHFYDQDGRRTQMKSECTRELCSHCSVYNPTTTTMSTATQTKTEKPLEELRTADVILIVLLSVICVFLCISITFVTCYFRKKIKDLRLRMLNNQPKIVYANDGAHHFNTLNLRSEATSNGTIHFQNEERSHGNDSGGVVNEAFLPDNYLHVASSEKASSPRISNPAGYSPLSNNPPVAPEMVKIQTRPTSAIQNRPSQRKPDLPPRDHPQNHKSNNSTSSLDSGNLTPNGYPKMGTGPSVLNGVMTPLSVSGSVSPRGSEVNSSSGQSQVQPRMGTSLQNSAQNSPLRFSPQEYSLQDKGHSPQTPNYTPPNQSPIRTPNFTPPQLSPVSLETFSPPLNSNEQRRTRLVSGASSPDGEGKISQV
ncbi:hypothetical protein FSP39_019176 [Pinctada imbricata]|uniref:Receptor ligand binding region domain-containing protein n=1 Tax=Pinctada imbricata TaxID=66713 RepID=A0AA88YEH9_PINIB|nr:hypothetical protein FSP39_019176 [Pinctada imbricata]